jgi:hypothetical protein
MGKKRNVRNDLVSKEGRTVCETGNIETVSAGREQGSHPIELLHKTFLNISEWSL